MVIIAVSLLGKLQLPKCKTRKANGAFTAEMILLAATEQRNIYMDYIDICLKDAHYIQL